MFQTSVLSTIGAGIVGEIAFAGDVRAIPVILDSASAANNVVGRAFYYKVNSAGAIDPNPVQAGGDESLGLLKFAGILGNPKEYANPGTSGDPLASTLTLPNGTIATLIQFTAGMWANLESPPKVGNFVISEIATGKLDSIAPADYVGGSGIPAGWQIVPNAVVARYNTGATGAPYLAVIALNGPNGFAPYASPLA